MQKQIILGILQKVRADYEFAAVWNGDSPKSVLKALEDEGLKMNGQDILGATVNSQDILDTKDVQWIIQSLGQPTNGSSAHHLPSVEVAASIPSISSTAGERPAESKLGLELQQGLVGVIKQIAQSYWYVTWMSNITFILGVALILLSAISALALQEDTASYLMGALGLAGVIGPLVFRPAQDLQNSRANLAQLQAIFINWINDVHNWNRYWELVMNQNRSSNQPPPTLEEVSKISYTLVNSARQMMELIEQYCELSQDLRRGSQAGKPDPIAEGQKTKDDRLIRGPWRGPAPGP